MSSLVELRLVASAIASWETNIDICHNTNCKLLLHATMAGAHDTAADDGQPITTIENTIAGPGPPLEAVGAMVRKCDEPKHVENPNTSRRTFQLPQAAQKTLLL